jgi:hypothetical protein
VRVFVTTVLDAGVCAEYASKNRKSTKGTSNMLRLQEAEATRRLHYSSAEERLSSDLQGMSAVNDRGWRGRAQRGRRSVVLNDSDYLSVSVNQHVCTYELL